jgi:hypothetical protein
VKLAIGRIEAAMDYIALLSVKKADILPKRKVVNSRRAPPWAQASQNQDWRTRPGGSRGCGQGRLQPYRKHARIFDFGRPCAYNAALSTP